MSFIHTLSRSYRDSSGIAITGTESITATAEQNIDEAVPTSQTDLVITIALTRANLKTVMLESDIAITVKTNSISSPTETIALAAGQTIIWSLASDALAKCPFSADITSLHLVNSSSTASGTFKLRTLLSS